MVGVREGVGVKVGVPTGVGVLLGVSVGAAVGLGLGVGLAVGDGIAVSVDVGLAVGAEVAVGSTRLAAVAQPPANPTAKRTKESSAQTHQRRMPRIYSVDALIARGTKGLMIRVPGLPAAYRRRRNRSLQ